MSKPNENAAPRGDAGTVRSTSAKGKRLSPNMRLLLYGKPYIPWFLLCLVIIGAEIAWLETDGSSLAAFLPAFGYNALTVGAGEAAVMYVLGMPLLLLLLKNRSASAKLREI